MDMMRQADARPGELRLADTGDIIEILNIISQAQHYFKTQGIDQWQNGYPDRSVVEQDVASGQCFVYVQNGRVAGTAVLSLAHEPTYDRIYDGHWNSSGPYGVIHRIAVDPGVKGGGIAGLFVDALEKMCITHGICAIRVDTHRDNRSMQAVLKKYNFQYCGIVYMADWGERLAFEKAVCIA